MKTMKTEKLNMEEFVKMFDEVYNTLYCYYDDYVYGSRCFFIASHIIDNNRCRMTNRDPGIMDAIEVINAHLQEGYMGSFEEFAAFGITYAILSGLREYYPVVRWWNVFNEYVEKGILGKFH